MSDGLPGDMEVPCDHGFEAACKNEARGRNRYQAEVIRLRAMLFETLEDVKAGRVDTATAKTVASLASEIVKTAELELRYAQTLSRLDRDQQGIIPGPMLLVSKGGPMDGKA